MVSQERKLHANDMLILDLESLSWSRIVLSGLESTSFKIHGHSLVPHTTKAGHLFVFGGKSTVDGVDSLLSSKCRSEFFEENSREQMKVLVVNTATGYMYQQEVYGTDLDARYAHCSLSVAYTSKRTDEPLKSKPIASVSAIVYGGLRTNGFGYCTPQVSNFLALVSYLLQIV